MLKKISLSWVVLLMVNFYSLAQFKKGDKMAGASVGNIFFNSGTQEASAPPVGSTTGKITEFGINISPSLGWFISDNTAVGILFNIYNNRKKTSFEENGSTFQKDNEKNFAASVGGFARNYFSSQGKFLPYGQGNLLFGISNRNTDGFFYGGSGSAAYKKTYDGNSSGGFFANASLNFGVTKLVGEYTGLDFFAGYNLYYAKNTMTTTTLRDEGIDGTIDITEKNETTTKFTNHGFIIGVGFQVFIKGKKK